MGASFSSCEVCRSRREPDQSDCRGGLCRVMCFDEGSGGCSSQACCFFVRAFCGVGTVVCARVCHRHPPRHSNLSSKQSVQQLLSTERHEAAFKRLRSKLCVRSKNLLLVLDASR